jgi:hypothetical protein
MDPDPCQRKKEKNFIFAKKIERERFIGEKMYISSISILE